MCCDGARGQRLLNLGWRRIGAIGMQLVAWVRGGECFQRWLGGVVHWIGVVDFLFEGVLACDRDRLRVSVWVGGL